MMNPTGKWDWQVLLSQMHPVRVGGPSEVQPVVDDETDAGGTRYLLDLDRNGQHVLAGTGLIPQLDHVCTALGDLPSDLDVAQAMRYPFVGDHIKTVIHLTRPHLRSLGDDIRRQGIGLVEQCHFEGIWT